MSGEADSALAVGAHEIGHAAAHLYFGFGVKHVSIRPDRGLHSGQTPPRTSLVDIPRYQLVVALLAGPRVEQETMTDEMETRQDVKEARRIAREVVGADEDRSPKVDELIERAWVDAGGILDRTADFRASAEVKVKGEAPFDRKKHVDVEDCWVDGVGYEISFERSDRNSHLQSASLTVDGVPAGSVTFAVDDGPDGLVRVELVNAHVPEEWRRRGHGQRLILAIRDKFPGGVVTDSPSGNSAEGDALLASLRRYNTIHGSDCYRGGNTCVCGADA